jgi:hypothetical protein
MIITRQNASPKPNGAARLLNVRVRDVTGTHFASMDLDPSLRVSAVADAVANRMALPSDTAWALRDDSTASFLPDDASIADALGPGARTSVSLVATPKAHLG